MLRPGFMLPPLMLTREEIEALVLGSRWVARRTDDRLALSARNALAKITDVLPKDLRDHLASTHLLIGSAVEPRPARIDLARVRTAIRDEEVLHLVYADEKGNETEREVWPFALGFFEQVRIIVAWCTLRQSYRHFRLDRIERMMPTGQRYPPRRQALMKEWRALKRIGEQPV